MRRSFGWLMLVSIAGCGGAPGKKATAPPNPGPVPAAAVDTAPNGVAITDHGSRACARTRTGGARRLGAIGSSTAVALARGSDGHALAYVADADDHALLTIDVDGARELARTPLRAAPEHVFVLADGRVAVTLRQANAVAVLEPGDRADQPLDARCDVPTATEPIAMTTTPDGATLLVTSGWAHALTAFDTATMARKFRADVPREPRSVVVSDDGRRAFVSHVVNAEMSVVDLEDAKARQIDLREKQLAASTRTPKVRGGCQGFALAKAVSADPDEPLVEAPRVEKPITLAPVLPKKAPPPPPPKAPARVFAPFVAVDPGDTRRPASGYGNARAALGPEVASVTVIDPDAERSMTRSVLEVGASRAAAPSRECLLPRAAAYANGSLYVACMGVDALVELDARALDPARAETRRWAMPGGPIGLAVDANGRRAVVFSEFARAVSIVPLGGGTPTIVPLGRASTALPDDVALGRVLFHTSGDARISRDGRACASCHPDGREDALTWSTPDGPRQTIMLAGRLDRSGAFGWSGVSGSVEEHLHHTFQRLEGTGLSETEVKALTAYVRAMPVPSAAIDPSKESLVARGREVFHDAQAGCASCHVDGAFTDGARHDVGSRTKADRAGDLATPSLRFLAGTAPYFHDGRYPTLEALLDASDDAMGHTSQLSREDRAALAAYLETL